MKTIISILILALIFGCKSSDGWAESAVFRPAENDPLIEYPSGMGSLDQPCLSPITDAEDGTELILMRSNNGLGDYQVQDGKYGLRSGELLRIDCNTREVVGIVRM